MRALLLILALSVATVAPAQEIQWPPEGSPVCTANGDQVRLKERASNPGQAQGFLWNTGGLADTVRGSSMGDYPPTGGCGGVLWSFSDPIVANTLTSAPLHQPFLLGCPCSPGPDPVAFAWIGRAGGSDEVVAYFPGFDSSSPAIIHTAVAGTVASATLAANGPWPTFDIDSTVVVAWSEATGPAAQVVAQRVNLRTGEMLWNGGTPIAVAATGTPQSSPHAARLSDGSTLIVWLEDRGAGPDVYAMRVMIDGTQAVGWPPTGLALESRAEASSELHLVEGGVYEQGPPVAVWQESGARFGGGSSVVARRLLYDSGLPDPAWSDSGVVLTTSRTVAHLEDVHAGVVVWSDSRAATPLNPTDLYAQEFGTSGAPNPGWPADGAPICTAPGRQDHARTDGTLFAWEDQRSGVTKVYATERTANGQIPCCSWLADGNPVALADGEQRNPVVDRGHVAWEDSRNLATTGIDIYGQIFNSEGRNVDVGAPSLAAAAMLRDPWPNPARAATNVHLDLPRAAHVQVNVFDLLGRRVRTIATGDRPAGPNEWTWRGIDDAGRRVAPGLYHVRAMIDGAALTRSVVLVR